MAVSQKATLDINNQILAFLADPVDEVLGRRKLLRVCE